MNDCIFCKILAGELPSKKVYEDDAVLAIEDIAPAAPIHVVLFPKIHVTGALDTRLTPELLAAMYGAVQKIAAKLQIEEAGFRLVTNVGPDGGQSIHHLHFHMLAGRRFGASFG